MSGPSLRREIRGLFKKEKLPRGKTPIVQDILFSPDIQMSDRFQ